jgi:aspartate carbamoyltransferase regulatory subunit
MTEKKPPERSLLISQIRDGTVIDHITAGEALNVLRILGIVGATQERLSIATNVSSGKVGRKDIVKVENRELRQVEVDRIALIAPDATINIIRDYTVCEKMGVQIPRLLRGVIHCPNPECISNTHEPIESRFAVHDRALRCEYCDWRITRNITEHII